LFIVWYEALKDGFDIDRIFDISFWVFVSFSGFSYYLNKVYTTSQIFDPTSWILSLDKYFLVVLLPYVLSYLPVLFFSRIFKWSKYRLLDIFSVASISFFLTYALGYLLIYGQKIYILSLMLAFVIYVVLLRFRSYKFFSGFIFSLILIAIAIGGLIFYRNEGYLYFYPLLITISLVNLYFRSRSIMIINKKLPSNIIKSFKDILEKKDKDLKKEQELLEKEDAYMVPGRATGNAEELDEVMLEDAQKEVTDLRLNLVSQMQLQVKKALAAIKIGKYGTCEVCGNSIDKARLKAYPEATKCFECASREK
jgi:RNA polymerase-binding transcription factor DksA